MAKIKARESQNVEYKSSWHDKYLEWICGFANAQGAVMYFGVNDNLWFEPSSVSRRCNADVTEILRRCTLPLMLLWCSFGGLDMRKKRNKNKE